MESLVNTLGLALVMWHLCRTMYALIQSPIHSLHITKTSLSKRFIAENIIKCCYNEYIHAYKCLIIFYIKNKFMFKDNLPVQHTAPPPQPHPHPLLPRGVPQPNRGAETSLPTTTLAPAQQKPTSTAPPVDRESEQLQQLLLGNCRVRPRFGGCTGTSR